MAPANNQRVLVVDDMPSIHEDFRRILAPDDADAELTQEEALLFGDPPHEVEPGFELEFAYQGREALDKVRAARAEGRPYAMAFVDMRMPPGWNGVETIAHLWEADPQLQVAICSAYSDSTWTELIERLNPGERLVLLRKPFQAAEALAVARVRTARWEADRSSGDA
jgi:CheY-like chemotaxis protein